MGLLTWVLVGLVAGVIAQFVVGGGVGSLRGLVIAILLGIGGAVLGGFVSSAMGWGDVTGFNIRSLVIASLGAIVVVLVWQQLSKRNSR
ncbi:MAG: GlsB/YeaQ/YmgE family stress response membrane protein [Dehalococcoidia bacterium]|nr:GlsB/YeaQ/YmgE family stress response membrane protein [Dehalococcoidia bacterium]MCB9485621.1 GlsB/YeaQ/YmgE family stress response membrane protein [Thermoflexaceae bacterium]